MAACFWPRSREVLRVLPVTVTVMATASYLGIKCVCGVRHRHRHQTRRFHMASKIFLFQKVSILTACVACLAKTWSSYLRWVSLFLSLVGTVVADSICCTVFCGQP